MAGMLAYCLLLAQACIVAARRPLRGDLSLSHLDADVADLLGMEEIPGSGYAQPRNSTTEPQHGRSSPGSGYAQAQRQPGPPPPVSTFPGKFPWHILNWKTQYRDCQKYIDENYKIASVREFVVPWQTTTFTQYHAALAVEAVEDVENSPSPERQWLMLEILDTRNYQRVVIPDPNAEIPQDAIHSVIRQVGREHNYNDLETRPLKRVVADGRLKMCYLDTYHSRKITKGVDGVACWDALMPIPRKGCEPYPDDKLVCWIDWIVWDDQKRNANVVKKVEEITYRQVTEIGKSFLPLLMRCSRLAPGNIIRTPTTNSDRVWELEMITENEKLGRAMSELNPSLGDNWARNYRSDKATYTYMATANYANDWRGDSNYRDLKSANARRLQNNNSVIGSVLNAVSGTDYEGTQIASTFAPVDNGVGIYAGWPTQHNTDYSDPPTRLRGLTLWSDQYTFDFPEYTPYDNNCQGYTSRLLSAIADYLCAVHYQYYGASVMNALSA